MSDLTPEQQYNVSVRNATELAQKASDIRGLTRTEPEEVTSLCEIAMIHVGIAQAAATAMATMPHPLRDIDC